MQSQMRLDDDAPGSAMSVASFQRAEAAGCGVLLYRGVGLREPVQQIATTLGWLRRGEDTVGTARQSSSR